MSGTAALFPPQVRIRPGEYRELYQRSDAVRAALADAADTLGLDLVGALLSDDEAEANAGPVARPAILALSVALYRSGRPDAAPPDYLAGLSLGQITAAHVAGAISFRDAVRMCHQMAVIEAEEFAGSDYGVYFYYNVDIPGLLGAMRELDAAGHYLRPCAYTADDQMIVTGSFPALERLAERALRLGGLGVVIPYGPPAHCELLRGVQERFRRRWRYADPLRDPAVPLFCNLTAEPLSAAEQVHQTLVGQYTSPVAWTRVIRRIAELGVDRVVVPGPGSFIQRSLDFMPVRFEVRPILPQHLLDGPQSARVSS